MLLEVTSSHLLKYCSHCSLHSFLCSYDNHSTVHETLHPVHESAKLGQSQLSDGSDNSTAPTYREGYMRVCGG